MTKTSRWRGPGAKAYPEVREHPHRHRRVARGLGYVAEQELRFVLLGEGRIRAHTPAGHTAGDSCGR